MNASEFLTIASAIVPERAALVCGGESRAYADLQERVNRLANALSKLGVARGDRVAILALNSIPYVETFYACARLGAVCVPLNYRAKQEELVFMVNNADASVLFVGSRYLDLAGSICGQLPGLRHLICFEGQAEGMLAYEDLIAGRGADDVFADVDDADPLLILYTSGTTDMPKGVVLTHQAISVYVANTSEVANPDMHDVLLLSVPLYHVAGATTLGSAVWSGRTMVLLPQFSPEEWLAAVQRQRVSHSFVVPTMLKRIMEAPDFAEYDISSLKLLAYGAAPMPYDVISRAVQVFRCGLMNAYGQTESTSTLTFLGPDDHVIPDSPQAEREKKLQRLRSVGRPMEDVEVAILSPSGEPAPAGQEGEIAARGARLMSGYWKREQETAAALDHGWLHTGDVGWMDEDGYLYITGRSKDLIIRGGENIAPGEIEVVLEQHPHVAEAAVIGVPDPEWGEEVKAVLVPGSQSPDIGELTAFVKARLASYKAPKYYSFTQELPRNYLGKLLKTEIRKLFGAPQNDVTAQ